MCRISSCRLRRPLTRKPARARCRVGEPFRFIPARSPVEFLGKQCALRFRASRSGRWAFRASGRIRLEMRRLDEPRVVFVVANLDKAVWGMSKPSMRGRCASLRAWLCGIRKLELSTKSKSPFSRNGKSLQYLFAATPCVIGVQSRDRALCGARPHEAFEPEKSSERPGGRRP